MSLRPLAPKKRFSQNFLTDNRTALKISQQLTVSPSDVILEIGPGTGALTTHLLDTTARRLVAVDVDPRAVDAVQHLVDAHPKRLEVRQADILTTRLSEVFDGIAPKNIVVIGNIPYAITSEILFWIFDQRFHMRQCVIMMQREVARRCVARPGTKDYGILSVASWYASEAKQVMTVQPGSFFPRPDVTSAVVRFDLRQQAPTEAPFKPFMAFVRAAFSQRRKVLTNALASWATTNVVDLRAEPGVCDIDLSKTRAEQLEPEVLARVFEELTNQREMRS